MKNSRELLREARNMESPDCLSPNQAERVVRGIIPEDIKLHLDQCGLCQAMVAAMKG